GRLVVVPSWTPQSLSRRNQPNSPLPLRDVRSEASDRGPNRWSAPSSPRPPLPPAPDAAPEPPPAPPPFPAAPPAARSPVLVGVTTALRLALPVARLPPDVSVAASAACGAMPVA